MTAEELKSFLDEKVLLYNNKNFIDSDPVQIPHLYVLKEDIEIAQIRINLCKLWEIRLMIL